MKNKILLIIALMISLILIIGCGQQTTTTTGGAFIGGTQGIVASFEPFGVEENGVYNIFNTESFPIEVTINNKGEYELQPGDVTVKLLGPAKEEFSGIPAYELKNKGVIEKISELVTTGGLETISFASEAMYKGKVIGLLDREWFANLEYKYQTYLVVPEVCLKEDLTDTRVCNVAEAKTFFVSGAPIQVKSVEESTAGKGIMALKIKISNVGSGKVTKVGEQFGVTDKLSFSIDDPAWECTSGGKVNEARLANGDAEIICKSKQPLAAGTLATKQVQMTFEYLYREIVQESLRLKQSSE